MHFPKTRKTRTAAAVGVAATVALMIVGPGSTAADAGRLIGSAAIKNNTIRSLDIRNETITGRDIKDGSLTAKDFSGALRGPAGPPGAPGTNGTSGPSAAIREWQITRSSVTSSGVVNVTSDDAVPTGTQVEAVKLVASGDFQSCVTAEIEVRAGNGQLLGSSRLVGGTWNSANLPAGGFTTDHPARLMFVAACRASDNRFLPLPPFTATVTLALTERSTTVTAPPFN